MNSKLHAVTDAAGRPIRMFLSAGQCSDYIGARALLEALPPAKLNGNLTKTEKGAVP